MHRKIFFELEQDEDGYPPAASESVWAIPLVEDRYVIDNIPFFAREATLGDIVEVTEKDGTLYYKSTFKRSGNSLIRIVYLKETDPSVVRDKLKTFGCSSEWDETHHLIAVSVPPEVKLSDVQVFLQDGFEQGNWDYEEPILMQ
jgi:hypothetical protein